MNRANVCEREVQSLRSDLRTCEKETSTCEKETSRLKADLKETRHQLDEAMWRNRWKTLFITMLIGVLIAMLIFSPECRLGLQAKLLPVIKRIADTVEHNIAQSKPGATAAPTTTHATVAAPTVGNAADSSIPQDGSFYLAGSNDFVQTVAEDGTPWTMPN
jgi:hypothetical protein